MFPNLWTEARAIYANQQNKPDNHYFYLIVQISLIVNYSIVLLILISHDIISWHYYPYSVNYDTLSYIVTISEERLFYINI